MSEDPEVRSVAAEPWFGAAILAGAIYAALGIAASVIGGVNASERVRLLARSGAFLLSGLTFVTHVVSIVLQRRAGPLRVARNAAVGAAIGGFLLAVSANMHELAFASEFRSRMLVAFAAWPVLTAVPAFVAALLLATVLRRMIPANAPRS